MWDDPWPLLPNLHAVDHLPIPTPLLDHEGNRLFRQPRPIGFGRDAEWQTKYLSHKS